jgi:predicted nicotinamide N-methyase
VLARQLIEHPQEVRNKVIIDFGAGSGVVGIAAALAGARRVICCDLDEDAQLACRVNAKLNGVDVEVLSDIGTINIEADLLVAADVLYDRDNLPLLDRLPDFARDVLIADSRIRHFTHPRYRRVGEASATTWPDLDEQKDFNEVKLYRLVL